MKLALSLVVFIALFVAYPAGVAAQEEPKAVQTAEELRAQLLDVEAKENDLRARARQVEEDLKPENIERSLAGIGSTRPEELRELRRRQLTIERDSVRNQLKLVGTSRERLEAAVRSLETRAYQESAVNQMLGTSYSASTRSFLVVLVSMVAIFGVILLMVMIRRQTS